MIDDSLLANPQWVCPGLHPQPIPDPCDNFPPRRHLPSPRLQSEDFGLGAGKALLGDEEQPDCFGYFAVPLGVDDLTPRATAAVEKAHRLATAEAEEIVNGFRAYSDGRRVPLIVPGRWLSDRLDLKFVAETRGQMTDQWRSMGLGIRTLESVTVEAEVVRPSADCPQKRFKLVSVSYDGFCEVRETQLGRDIRAQKMLRLREGLLVFSTVRATDGAIAVVPPELDGALLSPTSYHDCGDRETTEYVRGILRRPRVQICNPYLTDQRGTRLDGRMPVVSRSRGPRCRSPGNWGQLYRSRRREATSPASIGRCSRIAKLGVESVKNGSSGQRLPSKTGRSCSKLTKRKTPTEKSRKAAVRKWSATPSPNPRYKGATPGDVGRALLKRSARPTSTGGRSS